jgi:uncharacterized Zn finger protein
METLAGLTGDVEALVEVKKRDLSLAYHYLQIAEVYRQARKRNKALEWAERGVEAFPKHTDSRLREFLAEEYHRRKRHKEAMGLIWAEFEETSRLEQYENLKKHADRGGAWPQWREKALDRLRRAIAESQRPSRREEWGWNRHADNSELVRILLWEKDAEAAWSEAKSGGCHDRLWMELAANRERDYPEDALPVYQRQIEPTLSHGNNEAYRRAVELLRKVRELMVRLDRPAEFDAYLDSIRATFKRKRNFMKMLERAKW